MTLIPGTKLAINFKFPSSGTLILVNTRIINITFIYLHKISNYNHIIMLYKRHSQKYLGHSNSLSRPAEERG